MTKRKESTETFNNVYASLHPNDQLSDDITPTDLSALFYYYYGMISAWDVLNQGYADFNYKYGITSEDLFESTITSFWLFHGFPVENFTEKLATFIISNYTVGLSVEDYSVLFYVFFTGFRVQGKLADPSLAFAV
jgi:hypothetical protein